MMTAGIAFLSICILAVLGFPIVVALAVTTIGYVVVTGAWQLAVPQQMLSSMDSYMMLAMPLFIFSGLLMNSGGITARLFEFASALVGHMRAGLAQVDVVVSIIFGGMIGTSVADLAGTGSVIIPAMKKKGYPPEFAAAVSAASSGIGPLIPPSSPMILYAATTGTSLSALFLAGLFPGLLLGVTLMIAVAIIARIKGWKVGPRFSWSMLLRTSVDAALPLGMPAIIIGGLVFGIFTPTEAGAFALVYGIILCGLIYRSLSLRTLYNVAAGALVLTGEMMFIVGVASVLGWAMSLASVPTQIAAFIESGTVFDSQFMNTVILLSFALVAGMVLDPLIPIVMPILLPTVIALDIDLVHFGVLMVVTVIIGQMTPPVAIAVVLTAKIAETDVIKVFWACIPFFVSIFVLLGVLIAIPEISTWLPSVAR